MSGRFGTLARNTCLALLATGLLLGPLPARDHTGLPYTVIGVLGSGDAPAAGVRVRALGTSAKFETRSDEEGFFRLQLPALGSGSEPDSAWFTGHRLGFEAEGYVPCVRRTARPISDPFPDSLWQFLFKRAAASVCGVVRERDGTPVAGGRVEFGELWELWGDEFQEARAGPDGRFGPIAVPAGYGRLIASAPGRQGSLTILVLPGPREDRDVEVVVTRHEERASVAGRLLDADGRPAAGFRVDCGYESAVTDTNGCFEFPGEGGFKDTLRCFEGTAFRGHILPGEPLRLPPRRTYRLRVRDATTGAPLSGVVILPLNLVTDARGRVAAELPVNMPSGLRLNFRKAGYESTGDVMWPAGGEPLEFELRPSASVRLRVVDARGLPVVGASAWYGHLDDMRLTDRDGVARSWEGSRTLPQVTVSHMRGWAKLPPPGYSPLEYVQNFLASLKLCASLPPPEWSVGAGEHLDLGTLELKTAPPGGRTTILVTDLEGSPIPYPFGIHDIANTTSGNAAGRIRPNGHVFTARGFESRVLTPEQVTSGTLPLRPASPLTGRLIHRDGSFVDFKRTVYARGSDDEYLETPPALSDALGRFVLYGIPAGVPVRILVDEREVADARGGQRDVVIELTGE